MRRRGRGLMCDEDGDAVSSDGPAPPRKRDDYSDGE